MTLRTAWTRLWSGARGRGGDAAEDGLQGVTNPWLESPLDPAEALWLLRQGLTPGFYEQLEGADPPSTLAESG